MKLYVISDIHGCLNEFEYALSLIDLSEDNKLIMLGDYIHGKDGYGVLDKIMIMQKEYGEDKVVALLGNHEDMVLDGICSINDDDKLVIQHNLNEQIIDDTVYLFRYNDELFIKRLVKNVDQIVCISENPRFQDRIIEPKGDNFSIIGKVVGLFRNKV